MQSPFLGPKNFCWTTTIAILGSLACNFNKNVLFCCMKVFLQFQDGGITNILEELLLDQYLRVQYRCLFLSNFLFSDTGKLVNKLRKHEDVDIRRAARGVYVKWKGHFISHAERPVIEVMCDTKTETLRSSGRRLLAGALSLEVKLSGFLIIKNKIE